jgi:hypothetical protein
VLLVLFAVAMAYLEAAVVVYLRELYYPEGFNFPIKGMPTRMAAVEVAREFATVVMLLTVTGLAAKRFWERFGCFIILFGIWDIFYYAWLKAAINWPAGLTDWDVLFLIPIPWVGPVVAPILVSTVMILSGLGIIYLFAREVPFKPTGLAWVLATTATLVILYTFMEGSGSDLEGLTPPPYKYHFLIAGLAFYLAAFIHSYSRSVRRALGQNKGRSQ